MSDTQHTPESQLGRRFNLCSAHRREIDLQSGELCEICTLLEHKADLLAACERIAGGAYCRCAELQAPGKCPCAARIASAAIPKDKGEGK